MIERSQGGIPGDTDEQVTTERGFTVSRHELQPLDTDAVSCVAVGWDRPMGTYFAHVYLTGDNNEFDIPSVALGDDFFEVTDPKRVVDLARTYAEVPATLAETLHADAQAEGQCEAPALVAMLSVTAPDTSGWPCPF